MKTKHRHLKMTYFNQIFVLFNFKYVITVLCKIGVLKNFTKISGKRLCQSLFFDKVAGLRLDLNTFFYGTPPVAASVYSLTVRNTLVFSSLIYKSL